MFDWMDITEYLLILKCMRKRIELLADKYIPFDGIQLPEQVNLSRFDPARGMPGDLEKADALFIRTVTPITARTLPAAPGKLKLIGSATAGEDHVDREWLDRLGISFIHAPGCNARPVGEYVAVTTLLWSALRGINLSEIRAGIVGAGYTGQAVADLFDSISVPYILHDPPRQAREGHFRSASIDEILDCNLLTFHLPLKTDGKWATDRWLDREKLAAGRFRLIINTARGGVVDEKELVSARKEKRVENFVLDVWQDEPRFDDTSARNALFHTPHIAGYSRQAKKRATSMLIAELAKTFDLNGSSDGDESTADHPEAGDIASPGQISDFKSWLSEIRPEPDEPELLKQLASIHPIVEYHTRFRKLIGKAPKKKSEGFARLRTSFPLRDEFCFLQTEPTALKRWPLLKKLGISSGKPG